MNLQIIAYLLLTLASCGQVKEKPPKVLSSASVDTNQKQTGSMSDYTPTFEKAHSKAKQFMNEDFYYSQIDETGPFGNDDGSDTYAKFEDWRQTHKHESPITFLTEQVDYFGYPTFDLKETNFEKLKPYLKHNELATRFMSGIDAAIVSIAFGQLYLEGIVDKDIKEMAKIALNRELIPELLALWGDTYKLEREAKLKKMLAVLNQID